MNKLLTTALVLATVTTGVAGCYRHHNEGPAEHAGRKIDNAAEDVADSAHNVKENAKDAYRDVKEDTKEAAHGVKKAYQD